MKPTGDLVIKNQSFLTLFGSATPASGPQASWASNTLAFSSVIVVPEPSGSTLLAIGLASVVLVRRRC
ncbi:MAG: PEP-CTERM sorting domain-containing protein [Luteolibacter sp.]|uniref:PEP-CTERM sorting domain-containing protein n=1 Tax=Luteolibacter sp. TaxID=1962973 RepID=UPI00326485E1